MWENIRQSIIHIVTTWGTHPLVDSVITFLLTLTGVFFRRIWNFFSTVSKWLRAILSKQGKDYAFERAYLKWIVDRHRYLGLLPARVVAARWGDEGRNVDLEKVYVSLHISGQGADKNSTGNYTRDASSWRKQSRLYPVLVWLLGGEEPYQLGDLALAID